MNCQYGFSQTPTRVLADLERHLPHDTSRQWNNHWLGASRTICSLQINHHSTSLMKYPGKA